MRILDAGAVLATHRRSFDRGQQIEDPAHIEELERHKRLARTHRATDRLHHAAPSAKALFAAAAQRNHHRCLSRADTDFGESRRADLYRAF